MRILSVNIIAADTCGGLLNNLEVLLRPPLDEQEKFSPICLIGPNGTGKSQFLQIIAEIFQSIFHTLVSKQERDEGNPGLQFEIEYIIKPNKQKKYTRIKAERKSEGRRKATLTMYKREGNKWIDLVDPEVLDFLPQMVVGYTSGDNETLSLPFLLSRRGYAEEVRTHALSNASENDVIPDTKLMLIDYGTHLEVLVANLLLGSNLQTDALLKYACLDKAFSFRCIIQLAHGAINKLPNVKLNKTRRKGIQLTQELENYIDYLTRCSTCYDYDEKTETYIFDFLVNEETRKAFAAFWPKGIFDLYSAFHKLSMLNDLAIPKLTRDRFKRETKARRFPSRLPEPQDEEKVFRFERVDFLAQGSNKIVDYVSLSDGEHQLAQLLGTFCMISFPNVLFLLDEPESHFNPLWRTKFISRLLDLPTINGSRRDSIIPAQQDCLLTTHSPFVPSDMQRSNVIIFGKDADQSRVVVKRPNIETYGATFDEILGECFGVTPPISQEPRSEIDTLMQSTDPDAIKSGIKRLGDSVEKIFLAERLRDLLK